VPVLVRRLALAKWTRTAEGRVPADAPTNDLKTTGGKLSLWRCESASRSDLERAVLVLVAQALVAQSASRKQVVVDKVHLAWLPEAGATACFAIEASDGNSPLALLNEHHVNAELRDLEGVVRASEEFAAALDRKQQETFTRKEVLAILRRAAADGSFPVESLTDEARALVTRG
jgi:hypothetical protein